MGITKIEWAKYTFNGWIGCVKFGPECTHCYAEQWAKRFLPKEDLWGKGSDRHLTSDKNWNLPLRWNRNAAEEGKIERVFAHSLSDWAEERPELTTYRERLFDLIRATPNLVWLLLTKRCDFSLKYLEKLYTEKRLPNNIMLGFSTGSLQSMKKAKNAIYKSMAVDCNGAEYSGSCVELSDHLKIFLSCEPLLSDISDELEELITAGFPIAEIIIGGESGDKARPMDPSNVLPVIGLCKKHDIPVMFKQWGEWVGGVLDVEKGEAILDDGTHLYTSSGHPKLKTWRKINDRYNEVSGLVGKKSRMLMVSTSSNELMSDNRRFQGKHYNGMYQFQMNGTA